MSGYRKLQSETSEESTDGIVNFTPLSTVTEPKESDDETPINAAAKRPGSVAIDNTLTGTPPISPGTVQNWNTGIDGLNTEYDSASAEIKVKTSPHHQYHGSSRGSSGIARSKSPSQMTSQDEISKRMSEELKISRSPNKTNATVSKSPTRTPVRRRRNRPTSPRHNRSQSVKIYSRKPKLETAFRRRLGSVPTENLLFPGPYGQYFDRDNDEYYYCLRSFAVTASGGIINRGDSLRRRTQSYNSVASAKSYPSSHSWGTAGSSDCEEFSGLVEGDNDPLPKQYKVLIVGPHEVGKSALITQFLSSEYMNSYEASLDDDIEVSVSVLLDGEESEMAFNELTSSGSRHEPYNLTKPDAFVVVYSVSNKETFKIARNTIRYLQEDLTTEGKAQILVANKIDLVRAREVTTEEGKDRACQLNVKYIETSAAINHNVDELLVGILTQIRLKIRAEGISGQRIRRKTTSMRSKNRRSSKGIIDKLLGIGEGAKSKSCDNLYVP
ncbi:Uncharacterised protein g2139 [Pycnogonum litorale]